MRSINDQPLSQALGTFLQENRLAQPLDESRIRSQWESLMGKTIAKYTGTISLRKGTLYLTIISAPLRQELSFAKEKILRNLNEALGGDVVRDVVIR